MKHTSLLGGNLCISGLLVPCGGTSRRVTVQFLSPYFISLRNSDSTWWVWEKELYNFVLFLTLPLVYFSFTASGCLNLGFFLPAFGQKPKTAPHCLDWWYVFSGQSIKMQGKTRVPKSYSPICFIRTKSGIWYET